MQSRRGGAGYGILLFFALPIGWDLFVAFIWSPIGLEPWPAWMFGPWAIALVIAGLTTYRYNHRHWPWERKRHKIELYGHLIGQDAK